MTEDRIADIERIATAWDNLRSAINVVECALPRQMSEAISGLIAARLQMDAEIRAVGLNIVRGTADRATAEKALEWQGRNNG